MCSIYSYKQNTISFRVRHWTVGRNCPKKIKLFTGNRIVLSPLGDDNPTSSNKTPNSSSSTPKTLPKLGNSSKREDIWQVMKKDLLWTEARDVWYLYLDPVWADFHGTPATGSRPVPLVDAFPITLWLYKQPEVRTKKRDRVFK